MLKILRSDRGGGYLDNQNQDHLIEVEDLSKTTAPRTPQQNSVDERCESHVYENVCSMISY